MIFTNMYDLKKKFRYAEREMALFGVAAVLGFVLIIYCMIMTYMPQAFIINSAMIFFLSDRILNVYDYIIGYEENIDKIKDIFGGEYQYNENYKFGSIKYLCLYTYITMCILYMITFIAYRMSFDPSINNTTYELILTIALSMWTCIVGCSMGKVNSKIDTYIKMIKS